VLDIAPKVASRREHTVPSITWMTVCIGSLLEHAKAHYASNESAGGDRWKSGAHNRSGAEMGHARPIDARPFTTRQESTRCCCDETTRQPIPGGQGDSRVESCANIMTHSPGVQQAMEIPKKEIKKNLEKGRPRPKRGEAERRCCALKGCGEPMPPKPGEAGASYECRSPGQAAGDARPKPRGNWRPEGGNWPV